MNTKFLGAAAILAALGLAPPASATLVDVTYWGTVFQGYDQTGVFGPAGADLTGDSYVAHYVFDTTLGYTYSDPTQNSAYGGSGYGAASPAVSASVTISGHSASIGGDYAAEIYGYNDGAASLQYHLAEHALYDGTTNTFDYSQNYITNYGGAIPSSITGPFIYNVAAGDSASAIVSISTYNYTTGNYDAYAYANASITRLTVGSVGSVPEPSTWAMMLAGFAGLGYAGYRRTKTTIGAAIA